MKKIINLVIGLALLSFTFAFSSSDENTKEEANKSEDKTATTQKATPNKILQTQKSAKTVNVPKLANKSAKAFDKTFGEPVKITKIKDIQKFMPGEYREYKVKGHPKNLSVRFYKDKAKRFNLLLGKNEKSSQKALKKIFKVDVGGMRRIKIDALSETWEGKSGKTNYKTIYAKRSKSGGDFVMLHAEIR